MKARILLIAALALAAACSESGAPESTTAAAPQAAAAAQSATGTAAVQSATASSAEAPATSSASRGVPSERIELAQAGSADPLAEFQEGTHYIRLSPTQPTSSGPDVVEVAEFFMYSCPHCFNFEPYVQQWLKSKPDYVNFVRVPTVWNPAVKLHAQAFYTAEALGKGEEMHEPFFREMHVNGNYLQSKDALADFFAGFGVDRDTFENTFESFAVHTKLEQADELGRRYRVDSTPTIVVNGKYRTNASMTGGYDQLLKLVDALAASEHAAR